MVENTFLPALAQNSFSASSTSLPSFSNSLPSEAGAYVQYWTSNRADIQLPRIMGYGKIRHLLQPGHKYFENKWGEVRYWYKYLDKEGRVLLYPKVKTYHRENPYRKFQLNRQCSARAVKRFMQVVDNYNLSGLRVTDLELTCPKTTSEFLASKGKSGINIAWNMNERFWDDMRENGLASAGTTRRSNLHTWNSENPLTPHFHTHELIPNFEQISAGYSENSIKEFPKYPCSRCGSIEWLHVTGGYRCSKCYPLTDEDKKVKPEFKRKEWLRNKKYTFMPFTEKEVMLIKAIWLNININIARRYCIEGAWQNQVKLLAFQRRRGVKGLARLISFLSRFEKGLIDVYISFIKASNEMGMAKFMHKVSYNGRSWVEDYAVYSNNHPDCADPPEWLHGYSNKSRLFGWWRDLEKNKMSNLYEVGLLSQAKEKEKLSPYTAKPMEYLGRYFMSNILSDDSQVVGVDFIRGKPIERLLTEDDITWLKNVDFQRC